MRLTAIVLFVLVGSAASSAAAQPTPSSPHPRIRMSTSDLAAYAASATTTGSAVATTIAACEAVIEHPEDQMTRGGADGDVWPGGAVTCAFAWRVTNDSRYLTQAIASWRAALDDDQTLGDRLGCVAGVDTDWQTWAESGSGSAPAVIRTITHDTGYPIRWYGPYVALTYDWLYGAPGVDEALLAQTRTCLTAWIDYYAGYGYHRDEAGANYGAGFTLAQALGSVAIGTDGGADGHLFTGAIATYRDVIIAEGLAGQSGTGPAGPLVGGDWLEGWQYGPLSVLEYAIGARVLIEQGASLPETSDWIDAVAVRHVHGLVPTGDAQWTGGGDYDDAENLYPPPPPNVLDAVLAGPSSDEAAAYAASLRAGHTYDRGQHVYGAFASLRTVAPVDYRTTSPAPSTWYLSRGSRAIYARTSWAPDAYWTVFTSAGALVSDHQHFAASNFVLTRGADHLIVDTSQYGAPDSLETNALTADSPGVQGDYAMTQTPWSRAELAWARGSSGVIAARSDLADAFIFSDNPSDIPYAQREWVFLPEGQIVAIDRVHTADAAHLMYVSFHANTGGALALGGDGASGTVGGSLLTIHTVMRSGGTPRILQPPHLGDSSTCTTSYPSGDCRDARMPVDIYALDVPGPFATAVDVIDGAPAAGPAATVGSIGDAPYDEGGSNAQVIGAAIFAGTHQSYVLASSAQDGMAGASITYSVPGTSAARHIVFDAPEASDGTSSVTATASGGRCALTITAGSGGGLTGHPLMFEVATAAEGCTVMDGTDVPPGMPPTGGTDAGPRPPTGDGGPGSDAGTAATITGGCGCGVGARTNGLPALAALVLGLAVLARRRR